MNYVQKNGSPQKIVHEALSFLSEILIEEQQSTKLQKGASGEPSMRRELGKTQVYGT